MTRTHIINEFQAMVKQISKGCTISGVFKKLQKYNLSRSELMIIDSSIKGMDINNINQTLIISDKKYDKMLQNLTFTLIHLHQTEMTNM